MIKEYIVLPRQTLLDVCIQLYGSLDFISHLIELNEIEFDAELQNEQVILYDDEIGDFRIKEYYTNGELKPISNIDKALSKPPFRVYRETSRNPKKKLNIYRKKNIPKKATVIYRKK